METQFEKLAKEALTLSANERAAFAQLLLASLDEDAEVEEAWVAEAERRAAELDNGKADSVPLAEALAQLRSALK
jgi:putative addiction module component (TIGR02574 family)